MKKAIGVLGVVVVALLALSGLAWGGYIFQDPIFNINGHEVNVMVMLDLPQGQTVSQKTQVEFLVPRNVPARVVDPLGCVATVVPVAAQHGPLFIGLAMVKVPRTDAGRSFPVQATVFDDSGFSMTIPGRAGQWVPVPYIQWR